MRFFSKIIVVCNCCFILSVVFWYFEMQKQKQGDGSLVIPLPWLENTLVILGYGAIIVNALFLILYFIFTSFKIHTGIPRWMIIFNLFIFCCQVYFHFIFK